MFTALSCPQCGGALPRQALWRTVACPYCAAMVTRTRETVRREDFRQALRRAQAIGPSGGRSLRVGGKTYQWLGDLGGEDGVEVFLAQSRGPLPARVTVKLARSSPHPLAAEADALRRLQSLQAPGDAYFSQRLPQVDAFGRVEDTSGADGGGHALVLRHPSGFWGHLGDVLRHHPQGIQDTRHAVWLWRRALEVLAYVHAAGWTHGDLRPAHWLVHPADHGVLLTGWAQARRGGDAADDLRQSAWAIRALLGGLALDTPPPIPPRVPAALAALLRSAGEDEAWCRRHGAAGLEQALTAAARSAFGPPQFVAFNPLQA